MDGSQYGYFWQKASAEADAANWVLFMQGGGQCITQEMCNRTCSSKVGKEFLCSMKYFGATAQLVTNATWEEKIVPMSSAFLSAHASLNPIMATWNHVYLNFCSQDWWTGTRSEATNETFGYYFSGHLIMEAVISDMKQRAQLASAGSVVLTGKSSGGVGVNLHADWLKEQLPNVKVLAAPIAGFYGIQYVWPDPAKPLSLALMNVETVPSYVKLWSSFLPPACVASLKERDVEQSLCLLSSFVSQTHTVPKFVIQAQTDTAQLLLRGFPPPQATMVNFATDISSVLKAQHTTMMPNQTMVNEIYASIRAEYNANVTMWSFLNAWKMNQTVNLGPALKAGDGLFSPACFIHTSFFPATPLINEFSYVTAFNKWYADGTEVRLTDDCGLLCGTCSLSALGLSV
ncbi:unnamed protein product [Prorocentrum cordatum]|uniref:Pectin acetylesterase n=2 Tax=Prorocentrum cordatum TaxID=2364126 RepID=A0ABN9UA10_9DINO|nr:unnamed protein product [Polarella glacialis]